MVMLLLNSWSVSMSSRSFKIGFFVMPKAIPPTNILIEVGIFGDEKLLFSPFSIIDFSSNFNRIVISLLFHNFLPPYSPTHVWLYESNSWLYVSHELASFWHYHHRPPAISKRSVKLIYFFNNNDRQLCNVILFHSRICERLHMIKKTGMSLSFSW